MKPESVVEKTLAQLLAEFRETSTNDSDKGSKFERLTKFYLIKDPIWSEQLSNVRLREEANIGPDVGIDLVADDIASGGKVAIQCKFYDERTYLDDLGTFYTSSGKDGYVKRIVVTTSNQWTRNAEEALKNQQIPVQRILLHDMEQSLISWGAFDLTENYGSVPIAQKELRPHQVDALTAVIAGFKDADRGKMIMACGTGKTLISLRIAEEFFSKKKTPSTILFLAPSISLLSQTIMEWGQNKKAPYMALAVCSDSKVGKKDDDDMQVTDLAIPASTDVEKLSASLANRGSKNLVIFSTYQSLEIISKAQNGKKSSLFEFDLVVCDEAHRTTGVTQAAKAAVNDFSHFVRIHDNEYIKASKRLYMTATPKIYKDVDNKVADAGGVIASMDDPEKFGEEFYRLGFGTAVERGLLSDYRVLILAVEEEYVAKFDLERFRSEDSTINLDDASKLLGCWRGLSKIKTKGDDVDNIPMKRAVAFANTIDASQMLARRLEIVGRTANRPNNGRLGLTLETKHVDGTQNALIRRQSLEWLKSDPGPQSARILTNAKCLSEGIDVPALDAVIFTEARGSQVDIVQAVGRVMRKHEGKNSGYIILPVAITAGADINATLKGTKYKVIWEVLNALRAHDDRFDVIVNQINLNQDRTEKIEVDVISGDTENEELKAEEFEQGILVHLPTQIADGIYAKIVEKVGERQYWEKWAKDIADIAKSQQIRIETLISKKDSMPAKEFNKFMSGLRKSLNESISEAEGIEMLAQHMITKPIFDALFSGFQFTKINPVSITLEKVLQSLTGHLESNKKLEIFYEQISLRIVGIDNNASRQKLITELYERFFKNAFPAMAQKLGIVYTPVEIVDFIIASVEEVLKSEFSTSLSNKGVQVLDPFSGTGTFLVRLLQSGIISSDNLEYKFNNELHANEIVLLAYYIGAINVESTFAEITNKYVPFEGNVLADTFQMFEDDDKLDSEVFISNNKRAETQKSKKIQVIIGNPPFSIGQRNQDDNNQNVSYPSLDLKIQKSYAQLSSATSKRANYDSYMRAFRWASDRIKTDGVICFVSNGSFIDSGALDGFRKSIEGEFTTCYVFNLRGNQRTSGELSRREGGKIFGSGSRVSIAITLLVKNAMQKNFEFNYHDIGDYLTREKKLEIIKNFQSIKNVPWEKLETDKYGDWINKRSNDFDELQKLGDKKDKSSDPIFATYSLGVGTNRDAWAYNFSRDKLAININKTIEYYNSLLPVYRKWLGTETSSLDKVKKFAANNSDPTKISWARALMMQLDKFRNIDYLDNRIRKAMYRPFCKQWLYFHKNLNEMTYLNDYFFPEPDSENIVISANVGDALKNFGAIATNLIPDKALSAPGQCFPLFIYDQRVGADLFESVDLSQNGYVKRSGISDKTLTRYREFYGDAIESLDIFHYVYGLLNSPVYKQNYAMDLAKSMPGIPMLSDFGTYSSVGKRLMDLHINYDSLDPYGLNEASFENFSKGDKIDIKFISKSKDKLPNRISLGEGIEISDIPEEAFSYKIYGKSPVEWVMDRYSFVTDDVSGITNDPLDWGRNYPQKLVSQLINMSLFTVEALNKLPNKLI